MEGITLFYSFKTVGRADKQGGGERTVLMLGLEAVSPL